MSLSPETLELVSRGLDRPGLAKYRVFEPTASPGYVFDGEEYANYPTLAAYCKAKLRERRIRIKMDHYVAVDGDVVTWIALERPGSLDRYIVDSRIGDTDDLAIIECFAQAVAKGALP